MTRRRADRRERAAKATFARAHPDRWRVPAFLGAVLAVKLIVLLQLQAHPLLAADAGLDTASYIELAHRVTAGDLSLGPGLYYLSPLYIYFLAAVFSISDWLFLARVIQAGLGTLAVGCVFVAARIWFGRRAAWIAAALAALTGVLTFYEIVILQSALDSVLTAAALAALAVALAGPPMRPGPDRPSRFAGASAAYATAGVLFGLSILNRPNAALAVGGIALGLLSRMPRRGAVDGRRVSRAVVARNRRFHQFALVLPGA